MPALLIHNSLGLSKISISVILCRRIIFHIFNGLCYKFNRFSYNEALAINLCHFNGDQFYDGRNLLALIINKQTGNTFRESPRYATHERNRVWNT
jgi:hypothetical protein